MRGAADGRLRRRGQDLDGAEEEPALEWKVADEATRLLGQLVRVGPAHVLAPRARACYIAPPRSGSQRSRMSAAEALDHEQLHQLVVGPYGRFPVPETGDAG
jgi:hypothetical protein